MATLKYVPQYFTTTLNVGGGIDDSQTTGIVLQSVGNVDITKPGQICVTYSDPIDTSVAEWINYTSINGSNELVGAVRGREGYSAHTHLQNATVAFVVSASHINDINDLLTGAEAGIKVKTALYDANGNEVIKTPATTSAVNEVTITNSATGNAPEISATGGDTDIDLNLKGKGTGKVKLTAPLVVGAAGAAPTVAGQIAYDSTANIIKYGNGSSTISLAGITAGMVVQVVSAKVGCSIASFTSSTYADSGLTVSITPTSASNKILVICSLCGMKKNSTTANAGINAKLVRNSTSLVNIGYAMGYGINLVHYMPSASASYLDSPATTSATTYKVQVASFDNTSSMTLDGGGESSITVMEIAG